MAVMCAVQHNSVFREHYAQLLQRGKPRKVALVACIRKLLGILNAMLRRSTLAQSGAASERLAVYVSNR